MFTVFTSHTSIKKQLTTLNTIDTIDVQKYLDSAVTAITTQKRNRMLPMTLKALYRAGRMDGKINSSSQQSINPLSYIFNIT